MTMRIHSHKTFAAASLPFALGIVSVFVPAPRCDAQTQPQPRPQTTVAALHELPASGAASDAGTTSKPASSGPTAVPDPEMSPAVAKQLAAMQAEIEELKAALMNHVTPGAAPAPAIAPAAKAPEPTPAISAAATPVVPVEQEGRTGLPHPPEKPEPSVPFAYADWTWLNGNPRNKDAVWDSKFFTPEIRFDTDYVFSFNHPKDDTLGGSTEIFRSNEIQVEQISFGGDFHWQNVRGRVLTLGGMFGVTTPRNDASARTRPMGPAWRLQIFC